jgi:hypothetical protein
MAIATPVPDRMLTRWYQFRLLAAGIGSQPARHPTVEVDVFRETQNEQQ